MEETRTPYLAPVYFAFPNCSLKLDFSRSKNRVGLSNFVSELLQQYTDQRYELERLAQELAELNKEADEMVVQFEAAAEKYGQCAGAT